MALGWIEPRGFALDCACISGYAVIGEIFLVFFSITTGSLDPNVGRLLILVPWASWLIATTIFCLRSNWTSHLPRYTGLGFKTGPGPEAGQYPNDQGVYDLSRDDES